MTMVLVEVSLTLSALISQFSFWLDLLTVDLLFQHHSGHKLLHILIQFKLCPLSEVECYQAWGFSPTSEKPSLDVSLTFFSLQHLLGLTFYPHSIAPYKITNVFHTSLCMNFFRLYFKISHSPLRKMCMTLFLVLLFHLVKRFVILHWNGSEDNSLLLLECYTCSTSKILSDLIATG